MADSYATPLDRARSLLSDLVDFADARSLGLPSQRYVQIGDPVRDCESVIVALTVLAPDAGYDPLTCVAPRTSTFLVEIIRACAVTYDSNGNTIPHLVEEVSEIGANDGQLLDDFARESIDGWTTKSTWSVIWSLAESGLQVASLRITIGVP